MIFDYFRMLHELKKLGISNAEVANRLDVYPSTVERWKQGTAQPTFDHAIRFLIIYSEIKNPGQNVHILHSTSAYKVIVTPAAI